MVITRCATSLLIAYTRTGDANLDGLVTDDDVTIVGASYAPGVPNGAWALGDFDYNGFVDDDDITLLGAFYDQRRAPRFGSPRHKRRRRHPEPATWFLAACAAVVLIIPVARCAPHRRPLSYPEFTRSGGWRAGGGPGRSDVENQKCHP